MNKIIIHQMIALMIAYFLALILEYALNSFGKKLKQGKEELEFHEKRYRKGKRKYKRWRAFKFLSPQAFRNGKRELLEGRKELDLNWEKYNSYLQLYLRLHSVLKYTYYIRGITKASLILTSAYSLIRYFT